MKICEANEQTLGGAKSEPIKFSLFSHPSRLALIPFAALPLPRSHPLYPFLSRELSRGRTFLYLHVPREVCGEVREEKTRDRDVENSLKRRPEVDRAGTGSCR